MKHLNALLTEASLDCLLAGDHMLALQHHAAPLSAAGFPGLEGIAGVVQGGPGGAGSGSGTLHQPGSHIAISFWGPGLSTPGAIDTKWSGNVTAFFWSCKLSYQNCGSSVSATRGSVLAVASTLHSYLGKSPPLLSFNICVKLNLQL